MKERPIIFSGESVRAILEGRKTQTRRMIKLPDFCKSADAGYDWDFRNRQGCWNSVTTSRLLERYCPYRVGMRLWVRETYIPDPPADGTWDYYMYSDGVINNLKEIPNRFKNPDHVIYRASWDGDLKWRPSIFMPRWASRITLEIVNVRVERVQEINNNDVNAEGWPGNQIAPPIEQWTKIDWFAQYWDSINAKRVYPWASNPWVWVIEFRRFEPPKPEDDKNV